MGLYKRTNFANVLVSTGYDAAATSVVLVTGQGGELPAPGSVGFILTWWNATDYTNPDDDPLVERVKCTARSTDTLTVTRAQDGTSASAHNLSGKQYRMALSWGKAEIDQLEVELQNGASKYAVAGGGGNAFTLTLDPVPTAYAAGQVFAFAANHTISSAPTINVNGLGAKNIIGKAGASLGANDITNGDVVIIAYDGTQFQALSIQSSAAAIQQQTYVYVQAAGTANALTLALSATPASYVTGMKVSFKATADSSGACTINVNSLGAVNLLDREGANLVDGEIVSGAFYDAVYDGSAFRILGVIARSAYWDTLSNSYGSTATKIRQFGGAGTKSQGASITAATDATNGGTLTINKAGRYGITIIANPASAGSGESDTGLSINSSQTTTAIGSITAANRLAMGRSVQASGDGRSWPSVAFEGFFKNGDVIRVHGDGVGLTGTGEIRIERIC